jgi:hypothetical protein
MFCTPRLVFGGTEGIGSRFHVLRSRAHFRPYGGRRVSILCFAHPDLFSTVPSALVPVFMIYASGLIFDGTEGIESCFHILRSRTLFRRYGGCRVPFSYFALPSTFSAVRRASSLDFMSCAPELVFGGTVGVGSRFYVLRVQTRFRWYRGRRVPFSCFALPKSSAVVSRSTCRIFFFCAPGHDFGGSEAVESHFHVLCSRSRFPWYRGRWVMFSCFALPY